MSLDTVLKIGKALKESNNRFDHYHYTKSCPRDKKTGLHRPICISIPVNDKFIFDWLNLKLVPENESLYYLNFKTSSDSSPPKYFFGDIYYSRINVLNNKGNFKKIDEKGNFCFERGIAFENAEKKLKEIILAFKQNEAHALIPEFENEKEINIFKTGLDKYIKNPKRAIVKMLQKHSDEFERINQEVEQKFQQLNLLKFRNSFQNEFSKFEKILKYAPAIKSLLSDDKERMVEKLNNEKALQEEYLKTILNDEETKIKKLYTEKKTKDNLSTETKDEILKYADFEVFIHFDFSGKDWHEFSKTFALLTNKLNTELTETSGEDIIAKKSIYRTLCSGDNKNDIQFPNFVLDNRYKSFAFTKETFNNLLHTSKFTGQPTRHSIGGTSLQAYILPTFLYEKGFTVDLKKRAKDYEEFLEKRQESGFGKEPLFPLLSKAVPNSIKTFDVIFAIKGSNTTSDMIEISGLNRSFFFFRKTEIEKLEELVSRELFTAIKRKDTQLQLDIETSLQYLLGGIYENEEKGKEKIIVKTNSRYESHLLKIIPKMYLNNYRKDASLLPAFIQNLETIVRKREHFPIWINTYSSSEEKGVAVKYNWEKYQLLKHCFKLLITIQNEDNMKKISDSPSYQIGLRLGRIAKPLKYAIGSFEKSYVGLLTRRISTLEDCLKFKNEIDCKLAIHGKTGFTSQDSNEAANKLVEIAPSNYDKEKLAFGFFEGYFKYEAKGSPQQFISKMEQTLNSFESSEEIVEIYQDFSTLLEEYKSQTESNS